MQAHVYISGFVVGVGFRQFVKHAAKKNAVTGWVKNLPDGRVAALLQGVKENIETVIAECKKGPFLSEVENVEVVWEEAKENYVTFDIVDKADIY